MPTAFNKLIQSRWPWLAASLTLTVSLFVASTLGWLWYADQRENAARQLSLDLLWLDQAIAESLSQNERLLDKWGADLQQPGQQPLHEFLDLADGLMKENPALIGIDVVDRSGHRAAGLPAYSERPPRLPPVSDPLINEAIQRCLTEHRPIYSRVIEQFAPLWVLAVPITDEGPSQGVVLATYDLNQLLSVQVPWWFVQRYDLALMDRDNKRLSPQDGSLPDTIAAALNGSKTDAQRLNFGPDGSGLTLLAAAHTDGRPQSLLIGLALAVLGCAMLIIWLLRVLQRWLRERLASQQALDSSHAQMYAVLSGLDAAVCVSQISDGQLLFRNGRQAGLFGLQPDGPCCLLGWPGLAFGTEQASQDFQDRHNGRWYHLERRRILWVDRSPVVLDIVADISERREAANTARERDELLQHTARLASLAEFASGIAHELNQPLAAITNYAGVANVYLEDSTLQLDKARKAVRLMSEESNRAGKIIRSMKDFIQKRTVRHEVHDLNDLLREPLLLLAPLAERLKAAIVVHGAQQPVWVECDAVMIEQVLFNLIRNGIEAGATGGNQVTVQIHHDPAVDADSVTVSVTDSGPGIANPDKLFQPFHTTKHDGMGLGLAICRTVIESHGGRLWADTLPEGGACFQFRLRCRASSRPATSRLADFIESETP